MGLPFGLDDDLDSRTPAHTKPSPGREMSHSRGSGDTAMPRSRSEMGHRELSQLRDSIGNARELLPRETSCNSSMNFSALPAMNFNGANSSVRSSMETRPIKTEGGARKSVGWASDEHPRASTAFPNKLDALEGQLRTSTDKGLPCLKNVERVGAGTMPRSAALDEDLQTQLNLLRERSWSEQQSLRRQLDDHKAEKDKLKKELESASVRIQELQNEKASMKEMFDISAAVEKNGSATALIEEKNTQIRHLENLARELASGAGLGLSLQPPSRELANGGGMMGSMGAALLNGGKPSVKEQQLQQELQDLRTQRNKEQEDLKELEQVVIVFETKMEALKKENKDLKRQSADLKNFHAQSMSAQHQSSAYHQSMAIDTTSVSMPCRGDNAKLERKIEKMVILMCSLQNRKAAMGFLIGSFCRWKGCARSRKTDEDHQRTGLEFQLKNAEQKIANLKEDMENMITRHTNVMESEQAQGAMMAQRLLKAEESAMEKDKELAKLKAAVDRLEQELDSTNRRLVSTSAMLSSGGSEQDQTTLLHALEDDVRALKIVRTNLNNRMAVMRKVAAAKAVRDKDRSSIMHKFQVWRLLPSLDRHVGNIVFQSNRARNKVLKLQAFKSWFEQACLMDKAELQTAEEGSKEQVEYFKKQLAAEREAASSLSASHKEASARCEQLTNQLANLKAQQQSLTQDLKSGVSFRRQIEKVQPIVQVMIEGVAKAKDEIDVLQTMFQCALSENQGLRESMARLSSERDTWFEERARIQQRQATAAGGGSSDANATLLRDRLRIVTSKFDAAGLEISALQESILDANRLSDELQTLAVEIHSKGLLFLPKGAPHFRLEGNTESNPVSRARLLTGEIRTFFQGILQEFTEQGGPLGSDTSRLHRKVQDLMEHLSITMDELQNCKQEAKQQSDARQHEITMLTSALVLAKNEIKYLQEIADGGSMRDVYTRSVKSIEIAVSSLNKKFSKKIAECQSLERQLNLRTRSNIDKCNELDLAKRQLARVQQGHHDASSANHSPSEQEMQLQLQDRDRDLDIAREKMQHCMDSSTALALEVQELTALWRASAIEVFNLNDTVVKNISTIQGLTILSDNLKGQLKTFQEENMALNVKLDVTVRAAETMKENFEASKEEAASLERQVRETKETITVLENNISQLLESVQTLKDKHAMEISARQKAENELVASNEAFGREDVHLRSKIACFGKASEATASGLRALSSEIQEGMKSLVLCISEQESSRNLLEVKVQGASNSNETLTKRLHETVAALQSAQSENDRLQQDLAAMRNETDSLQDQMHEQSGQNISLTKENRKLATLKENMEIEIKKLNGEIKKLNDTSESQLNEIAEIKQRFENSMARHEEESDGLRDKIKSHISEFSAQQKEHAEERQRVVLAHRTIQQLEEDLIGARSALEELHADHSQLSEQLLQLRQDNNKQKIELQANSLQHSESQKQQADILSNALRELENLKMQNQALCRKTEVLNAELSSAQEHLSRTAAEKTEIQGSLESQSNQTHAWLAKAQELERQVTAKDSELSRIREAADKAEAIRREAEKSMQAAQKTAVENIKSLQSEGEKDRLEKTKIETEKMYLQERVQKLKSQFETALEDVREREEMIEKIQKDSFMLQVQLLESLNDIKARDHTLSCMEARFFTLINSYQQSLLECDKRQQLLDECRASVDAISQELEETTEKCAKFERQLQDLTNKNAQELAELDKVIERERQDTQVLSARMHEVQVELDDAKSKCTELQGLVDEERAVRVSSQEALAEQRTITANLEESVAAMQHEKEAREKDMESCRLKLLEAGRVMEAFHAEKERFRLKTMDLQHKLDESNSNLVEKESDYVELEGKLEQLSRELDRSKITHAELEVKYAAKNGEIEEFQCQLTHVGAELAAANKEVDRQKILHSKQMEQYEHMRQALNDQATLVTEAEEKVESLREELRLKEAAAQDLVASLEQQMTDLGSKLSQKEGEVQEAKAKQSQIRLQFDALSTRCSELEQENARTTSKFFEYDEILQTKGKELAKTHGSLAEARSLAEDAELRVQSMKVMEEKLRRELASKDKQLRALQQNMLDGSTISLGESLEGSGMMAAMEKDYAHLQESLQAAHQETESLQRERETARRQANDLQERLQNTELQVVSLKLEIEAKQAELDGLYGKVSRLEQAMSAKNDDDSSKATTARVTPTRGFESGGEGQGDESCSQTAQQLAAARHELAAIKQELQACQKKLKEKSQLDLARLSVRCHKSMLRREEEHERQADLEGQLVFANETSQAELCEMQKQLVEKTNMLLESEKKFAQLLAWVQKNKAK